MVGIREQVLGDKVREFMEKGLIRESTKGKPAQGKTAHGPKWGHLRHYTTPSVNNTLQPRGGGGATPWFWTPTTPPTDCWPEAPWGGGGGGGGGGGIGGGVQGGRMGGGVQEGRGGGAPGGSVGGGPSGTIWGVGGGGGTGSPYLPLPSL